MKFYSRQNYMDTQRKFVSIMDGFLIIVHIFSRPLTGCHSECQIDSLGYSYTLLIRPFFKRYTRSVCNNLMIINDFIDIMRGNITTEIKKRQSIDKNSCQQNGVAAARFMFMTTS